MFLFPWQVFFQPKCFQFPMTWSSKQTWGLGIILSSGLMNLWPRSSGYVALWILFLWKPWFLEPDSWTGVLNFIKQPLQPARCLPHQLVVVATVSSLQSRWKLRCQVQWLFYNPILWAIWYAKRLVQYSTKSNTQQNEFQQKVSLVKCNASGMRLTYAI